PTNTGMVADHRLAVRPQQVEGVARLLAQKVGVQGVTGAAPPGDEGRDWVEALAKDLNDPTNRGKSVVLAGDGQPAAVHALAYAINAELKNVGETVHFAEPPPEWAKARRGLAGLKDLSAALNAGKVKMLLVLGGNPAYTAPADLELADRIRK